MSLAQGNNTPTRPRIEPGSPDPESDALTARPVRPQKVGSIKGYFLKVYNKGDSPIKTGGLTAAYNSFMKLYNCETEINAKSC